MLSRRNVLVKSALCVGVAALAAALAGPPSPASAGGGTLNVVVTPGNPIAIAAVPVSSNDPSPACLAILVRTSIHGWALAASYAATPSAAVNVTLERRAAGDRCGTSAIAGTTSPLRDENTTTLLSNQNGSQTAVYALVVRPVARLASPIVLTLTFVAGPPGGPNAQSALTVALDRGGRVSAMPER